MAMLHRINEADLIDRAGETHYRFHTGVDTQEFPQVHDFYEFSMTVSGRMALTENGSTRTLPAGSLVLLRPGDVHTRRDLGGCRYINLAFPARTVAEAFAFLGQEEALRRLRGGPHAPCVHLSPGEAVLLQSRMERLALVPGGDDGAVRAMMRVLLVDCLSAWFIPLVREPERAACPLWLRQLLPMLEDPANRAQGMRFLVQQSGRSTESLCHSFRRYLGVTPNAYLNALRLHYAANMLRHSDRAVLDIAYEAGFRSESAFYAHFTREYGMSPRAYRRGGA